MADLADRIEAATGPGRELDAEIAKAVGTYSATGPVHPYDSPHGFYSGPHYSASVDAALSLVPEGWWLQYLGDLIGGAACRLETNGPPSQSIGAGLSGKPPVATRALAVCLAAIRARTLKEGTRK